MAAAHVCVPLQQLLGVFAQDISDQLRESVSAADRMGFLSDAIEVLDYEDAALRAQAMDNVAMVARASRLIWIKEQLEELEQVWPAGEHAARAPRRVYRDHATGEHFAYIVDPEEMVLCSSADALRFIAGAALPIPRP